MSSSLMKVHQMLDTSLILQSMNTREVQVQTLPNTQESKVVIDSTEEELKSDSKESDEQDIIGKRFRWFYSLNSIVIKLSDEELKEQSQPLEEMTDQSEISDSSYTVDEESR